MTDAIVTLSEYGAVLLCTALQLLIILVTEKKIVMAFFYNKKTTTNECNGIQNRDGLSFVSDLGKKTLLGWHRFEDEFLELSSQKVNLQNGHRKVCFLETASSFPLFKLLTHFSYI